MARGDFPSAKQDQFVLRFPEGLRDRIKSAAEENGRSMNAEIISVLEEAYPDAEKLAQFAQELNFLDEIDEIQERLERIRAVQHQLVLDQGKAQLKETDRLIKKADKLLGDDEDET
jgi:hypothetical protein